MGNFAALVGCPSKEAAQSENLWGQYWDETLSDNKGWGPVWLSKYCIGGFWMACFSSEDEIFIQRKYNDGEDAPKFIGYFVSAVTAVERLKRRKSLMMTLVPEPLRAPYSDLYENWVTVFQIQFRQGVFLDCDDLFDMIGEEEGSTALREHISLVEALEAGSTEVDLIDFGLTGLIFLGVVTEASAESSSPEVIVDKWRYSLIGGPIPELSNWPPRPNEAEMEFARQVISEMKQKISSEKPWWKFWL